MFSYPAKCLCQVLFVFIFTIALLHHAHATAIQRLNNGNKTEAISEIKKVPKLDGQTTGAHAVINPKLTLSTKISSLKLASKLPTLPTNSSENLTTSATTQLAQQTQESAKPSNTIASLANQKNLTNLRYQDKKTEVEQAFEFENRLLLGLVLIFVTGLLIVYLISKYRMLL